MDVLFPVETGSLKAVYLLALAALDATHIVDEQVMGHLAEAVFESYLDTRAPLLPLSSVQAEDMAVLSIELLTQASPDLLVSKH